MDGTNVSVICVTRLVVKSGTVQILLTMQHSLSLKEDLCGNWYEDLKDFCMPVRTTMSRYDQG